MFTSKNFLLIVLLLSIAFAQTTDAETIIQNNPELQTIVNNYYGCAEWDGNTCLKCSVNYYFNLNGICCCVNPQCRIFNQDVGIC